MSKYTNNISESIIIFYIYQEFFEDDHQLLSYYHLDVYSSFQSVHDIELLLL